MAKGSGGGGAGGSSSGGSSVSSAETFGASKARVTHFDYESKEISAEVKNIMGKNASIQDVASAVGAPDDASVNISIRSSGELGIGMGGEGYRAQRKIVKTKDGWEIKNESFDVDKSKQGQGIGSKVFGRQVEQASKMGAKRINTLAAGSKNSDENGYYTWARLGYDAPIPSGMSLPKSLAGAKNLSDLMKTEAGTKFWEDNGSTIGMSFDLKRNSRSQKALDKYLKKKGIKK